MQLLPPNPSPINQALNQREEIAQLSVEWQNGNINTSGTMQAFKVQH